GARARTTRRTARTAPLCSRRSHIPRRPLAPRRIFDPRPGHPFRARGRPARPTAPMAPRPKMPSVDPRSRCDSVQGHSPRFMRSASSATLRRARRHDQCKRELGRPNPRIALAGRDPDPELGAGGEVDHLGIAADERNELELRQPFEQRAGKFDALAYRDDDVGIAKAFDELGQIARRLTIAYDVVMADQRKTF